MEYNDGATTLFLNITGISTNVSQDLKELLAYMKETCAEKAVNPRLKEIKAEASEVKSHLLSAKEEIERLKAELKRYQTVGGDRDSIVSR